MSQLLDRFMVSVHEFNACRNASDYKKLAKYYHPNATLCEVDYPYTPHNSKSQIIKYFMTSQSQLLARFWPDLQSIRETPNSDNKTIASLDGSATYFDSTTGNPAGKAGPIYVKFHFDFERADTQSDWLVIYGEAH